MLSPRWRKVLRDLWSNKTRTLLVVLSIAVGVFAVGMIVSSQLILSQDLSSSYADTNPPHAILYGHFDHETVNMVRRMEGIKEAEGQGRISVQLMVGPDQLRDVSLLTISDYDDIRIRQLIPISGAWPPDDREFLIEQASLEATGAQVGDLVEVQLQDDTRRRIRISGVVHDLSVPSAMFDSAIKGYINFETQEWLGGGEQMSRLQVIVEGEVTTREQVQSVADVVKDKLEKGGHSVRSIRVPPPGKHWADSALESMMLILGAMGFLSLILSGFLVINTISALLAQQTRQIGVMKTLGARTGQLISMYLTSVFIFGLFSLTIAVPLGAWASHTFVNFVAGLLNFYEIGFRIPPQALALEIGIGLLVPILAALWPVMSGTRLTIQQALNANAMGGGEFGNNSFDQLLQKITGLPRPLLLSLRNTFRRKARLLLTLSTLVLGGAIFIAVLTVHSSLMTTLDEALGYWNYDIEVNFTRAYRIEQITREALRIPGVVAAESWSGSSARRVRQDDSESDDIFVLASPAETIMINPKLLEGRWLLPEDENALVINTVVLEEESDIKVGDEIELEMEARKSKWLVVGIVQGVMSGPMAYSNYPYFAHEIGFVGRANSVQVVTEQHDPVFQQQIERTLTEHFESKGLNVASTESISEERDRLSYQFNLIVTFLSMMAVLIAVVGALGLAGTMSMNVLERSREIGVMRAIGASDGSVLRIFLVEGVLIGMLSWLIGGLLSLPISKLLSDVVGVSFIDAPLSYTFSTDGAFLWLALVIILAALSSWWPSWRASRLTVRDILAYE
ncbi:MAG: ABC transporter permease [Ardenticatenaceae bacterium]